jgi:hypothetical protein
MNQRRRNLLIQIGAGLSVGIVVPLAVIMILLLATHDDSSGTTVRISPTAKPAQAHRGLQVTRGKDLERYLLTPAELGSGWTVVKQGKSSGLSIDKAVNTVPDNPDNCADFPGFQADAFETPWASTALVAGNARKSLFETVYVFRPGMAQEALAYLRGLVARCAKYDQKFKVGRSTGTAHVTTTVSTGPRLGDESLRVGTRYTYSGGFGGSSHSDGIYVRIGDTVLLCRGAAGVLDTLTAQAFAKLT